MSFSTHTLVKLPVTSAGHGWVITAVHLSNVVALDVGDLVHGQVAGKGHLRKAKSRTTTCGVKLFSIIVFNIMPYTCFISSIMLLYFWFYAPIAKLAIEVKEFPFEFPLLKCLPSFPHVNMFEFFLVFLENCGLLRNDV